MTAKENGNSRRAWSTKPLGKVRRVDVMFPLDERAALERVCLHYGKTASGLIRDLITAEAARLDRDAPNWRATAASEGSDAS